MTHPMPREEVGRQVLDYGALGMARALAALCGTSVPVRPKPRCVNCTRDDVPLARCMSCGFPYCHGDARHHGSSDCRAMADADNLYTTEPGGPHARRVREEEES